MFGQIPFSLFAILYIATGKQKKIKIDYSKIENFSIFNHFYQVLHAQSQSNQCCCPHESIRNITACDLRRCGPKVPCAYIKSALCDCKFRFIRDICSGQCVKDGYVA